MVDQDKDPVAEVMRILGEISPALGPSLAAFLGGVALLLDDAKDFGKLGDERDPHRMFGEALLPHHWLYGVILMLGGIAGLGVSLVDILASDPKVAKEMLEQFKELELARKALSPEALEKILKKPTQPINIYGS